MIKTISLSKKKSENSKQMEKFKCELCNAEIYELQQHKGICEKVRVECPNKCGYIIPREKIEKHIKNECELSKVECPFKKFGCDNNKQMLRKEFENNSQLLYLFEYLSTLEKKIEEINSNNSNSLMSIKDNDTKQKKNEHEEEKEYKDIEYISKTSNISFISKRKRPEDSNIGNYISITNKIPKLENELKIQKDKSYKETFINPSLYKKKENIFDMTNKSEMIYITGNIARYITNGSSEINFLFASKNIDIRQPHQMTWRVKLLTNSSWIGIGLCDKQIVLSNKSNLFSRIHGCFIISSNGHSWNSTKERCEYDVPNMSKGSEIVMTYDPFKRVLSFKRNECNTEYKMNNVYPITPNSTVLTPCIIFMNNGDSAQMIV